MSRAIDWKHRRCNEDSPRAGISTDLVSVGKSLGLSFNYDKVQITPNTFKGHRLIWWSRRFGKQDLMAVALLEAYAAMGDADSADMFTGLSKDLDESLWFLEARRDHASSNSSVRLRPFVSME